MADLYKCPYCKNEYDTGKHESCPYCGAPGPEEKRRPRKKGDCCDYCGYEA